VNTVEKEIKRMRKGGKKQMADMRKEGHTFQQIGDKLGVSKQAVQQRLKRYDPELKPAGVSEEKAAAIIGCSTSLLSALRERGVVNPKRMAYSWAYDANEIQKALLATRRICPHCGKEFLLYGTAKYCPECRAERKRYPYPFLSAEGKKKFAEYVNRWRDENPERRRVIDLRAKEKYREKHRKEHQQDGV